MINREHALYKITEKNTYSGKLILLSYFMFSFSDFYFHGIGRVFDYSGVFFLFFYLKNMKKIILKNEYTLLIPILFLVILYYVFLSFMLGKTLSTLAFSVGIFYVFPIILLSDIKRDDIRKLLDFLIVLNVSFFLIQLFLFKVFGLVLDINKEIGSIPARVYNENLSYFRAAGLFQEPNTYSANLFIQLSVRLLIGRSNKLITWSAYITMILSQSLWGIGASVLLATFFSDRDEKKIIIFFALLGASYVIFNAHSIGFMNYGVLHNRLTNIDNDPSRIARYGSISSYFSHKYFFGHGIDTSGYQKIAANGIAFVVYAFGISGAFLFLFLLQYFFLSNDLAKFLIIILFLFTTDQMMTYMIFWAWLALLIKYAVENKCSQKILLSKRLETA